MGQGTGLGLATVYGIVKQNNGFINVYSEPGEGTTVKIYLPRDEGTVLGTSIELDEEAPQGNGETVLLVEDAQAILELGCTILDKLGYQVLSANTPSEARRLAEGHVEEIDLVVTDVVMPEMNGRELSDHLRTLYPNVEILFMSGHTSDIITHRGILDEGVNFMQKPFSFKEFAVKVSKALGKRQASSNY